MPSTPLVAFGHGLSFTTFEYGPLKLESVRRAFAIEIVVCPHCGGARWILGAVTEPHAVRRLLVALGLPAEPPSGPAIPAA